MNNRPFVEKVFVKQSVLLVKLLVWDLFFLVKNFGHDGRMDQSCFTRLRRRRILYDEHR